MERKIKNVWKEFLENLPPKNVKILTEEESLKATQEFNNAMMESYNQIKTHESKLRDRRQEIIDSIPPEKTTKFTEEEISKGVQEFNRSMKEFRKTKWKLK